MLGYYIYGIAKPGGNILHQILMFEKRNIKFMLTENNITNCWQLKLKIYRIGFKNKYKKKHIKNFFLAFIDELKKQQFIQKTVEVRQ